MTAGEIPNRSRLDPRQWLTDRIADADFQRRVARLPLLRRLARRDGARIFDIVQGFVASQALLAGVETGVFRHLRQGPARPEDLAPALDLCVERTGLLMQALAALGLLRRHRSGRYRLSRQGAALLGVPGLEAMILHHRDFYADLVDPVALLRGGVQTRLSRIWPYVRKNEVGSAEAAQYSALMAGSQALVAEDTLDLVPLEGIGRLMDVGGGTGAFLRAVAHKYPSLQLALVDLPEVVAIAGPALAGAGLADRVALHPTSFREPLPGGADAISLVRVLYDHDDATVTALLKRVHDALPPGGRVIVSEPMAGGARPERAGDVYFAFYTMTMGTGRARSAERIAEMLAAAGFDRIACLRGARPYVTSCVTGTKQTPL